MRTRGGSGAVPILKKAPTHFYKQEVHSILQKLNLWVCYNARVTVEYYLPIKRNEGLIYSTT